MKFMIFPFEFDYETTYRNYFNTLRIVKCIIIDKKLMRKTFVMEVCRFGSTSSQVGFFENHLQEYLLMSYKKEMIMDFGL